MSNSACCDCGATVFSVRIPAQDQDDGRVYCFECYMSAMSDKMDAIQSGKVESVFEIHGLVDVPFGDDVMSDVPYAELRGAAMMAEQVRVMESSVPILRSLARALSVIAARCPDEEPSAHAPICDAAKLASGLMIRCQDILSYSICTEPPE